MLKNSTNVTFKELEDKLFAVHTTNYLPVNGKQIAKASILAEHAELLNFTKNMPNFRYTLHWCLGRVVPSSGLLTVDEDGNDKVIDASTRKYAIVTKLKNLYPQLVNIYLEDTFILGDYEISAKDTVIIPTDTDLDISNWPNANIRYYNPSVQNLDAAVHDFIMEKQGCIVVDAVNDNDSDQEHAIIYYNNGLQIIIDKKDPYFWETIIKELDISFGLHDPSGFRCNWQGSYLCMQEIIIQKIICVLVGEIEADEHNLDYLLFCKKNFSILSNSLIEWVKNTERFPQSIKAEFISYQENLGAWVKLLDLEIFLIKEHQKTLMGIENKHMLINNIMDQSPPKTLEELYLQYKDVLKDFPFEYKLDNNFIKYYTPISGTIGIKFYDFLSTIKVIDFLDNFDLENDETEIYILEFLKVIRNRFFYKINLSANKYQIDSDYLLKKLLFKFQNIFKNYSLLFSPHADKLEFFKIFKMDDHVLSTKELRSEEEIECIDTRMKQIRTEVCNLFREFKEEELIAKNHHSKALLWGANDCSATSDLAESSNNCVNENILQDNRPSSSSKYACV